MLPLYSSDRIGRIPVGTIAVYRDYQKQRAQTSGADVGACSQGARMRAPRMKTGCVE